jgi:hypothetical protein
MAYSASMTQNHYHWSVLWNKSTPRTYSQSNSVISSFSKHKLVRKQVRKWNRKWWKSFKSETKRLFLLPFQFWYLFVIRKVLWLTCQNQRHNTSPLWYVLLLSQHTVVYSSSFNIRIQNIIIMMSLHKKKSSSCPLLIDVLLLISIWILNKIELIFHFSFLLRSKNLAYD